MNPPKSSRPKRSASLVAKCRMEMYAEDDMLNEKKKNKSATKNKRGRSSNQKTTPASTKQQSDKPQKQQEETPTTSHSSSTSGKSTAFDSPSRQLLSATSPTRKRLVSPVQPMIQSSSPISTGAKNTSSYKSSTESNKHIPSYSESTSSNSYFASNRSPKAKVVKVHPMVRHKQKQQTEPLNLSLDRRTTNNNSTSIFPNIDVVHDNLTAPQIASQLQSTSTVSTAVVSSVQPVQPSTSTAAGIVASAVEAASETTTAASVVNTTKVTQATTSHVPSTSSPSGSKQNTNKRSHDCDDTAQASSSKNDDDSSAVSQPKKKRRVDKNQSITKKIISQSGSTSKQKPSPSDAAQSKGESSASSSSNADTMTDTVKNNHWKTTGVQPYQAFVYNEDKKKMEKKMCYSHVKRGSGSEEVHIRVTDDIFVNATDDDSQQQPYIAKVFAIWCDKHGAIKLSVMWYYRYNAFEDGKPCIDYINKENGKRRRMGIKRYAAGISELKKHRSPMELFSSMHFDTISVATVEDICYVTSFDEFNRTKAWVAAKRSGYADISSFHTGTKRWEERPRLEAETMVNSKNLFFNRYFYDCRTDHVDHSEKLHSYLKREWKIKKSRKSA